MAYTVPKLTDYSAAALERAAAELLDALEQDVRKLLFDNGKRTLSHEAEWKLRWDEWKGFRDRWIARKSGVLTQINDVWLKRAPKEAKRAAGQLVNDLKKKVEEEVARAEATLSNWETDDQLASPGQSFASINEAYKAVERVDITLPGARRPIGAEHPVMRTSREMVRVFQKLGYSVADGPVVETDYYNFEALNFPPNHPARDTQDTLFIAGQQMKPARERLLLRTHTSPVQIRTMEKMRPPIAL